MGLFRKKKDRPLPAFADMTIAQGNAYVQRSHPAPTPSDVSEAATDIEAQLVRLCATAGVPATEERLSELRKRYPILMLSSVAGFVGSFDAPALKVAWERYLHGNRTPEAILAWGRLMLPSDQNGAWASRRFMDDRMEGIDDALLAVLKQGKA